jgi:hemolysin III
LSEPASYDRKEEIASSLTHGLGVLASISGLVALLLRAVRLDNPWMVAGFTVYGSSLILLFLASTLYHAIPYRKVKSFFRVVDHGSIYILIAGTYTPFTLISLRGNWGWPLFGVIWGLALGGILFNSFSFGRFPHTGTATYVLMGWLSVIVLGGLFTSIGLVGVSLLISGGLVYTLGVIFYKWEGLPYNHSVWHLFVVGGGVCHFLVIYLFVTPR